MYDILLVFEIYIFHFQTTINLYHEHIINNKETKLTLSKHVRT